jgi:hypothetical protein
MCVNMKINTLMYARICSFLFFKIPLYKKWYVNYAELMESSSMNDDYNGARHFSTPFQPQL